MKELVQERGSRSVYRAIATRNPYDKDEMGNHVIA